MERLDILHVNREVPNDNQGVGLSNAGCRDSNIFRSRYDLKIAQCATLWALICLAWALWVSPQQIYCSSCSTAIVHIFPQIVGTTSLKILQLTRVGL